MKTKNLNLPDFKGIQQNLYVVFDKVKQAADFCTLNFNDSDFIRCNLPIIHSRFQMNDIDVYNLGPIDYILRSHAPTKVDFSLYTFETESENLKRMGMKQDEIEAYFAEKNMKNRGITEKQIISIMKNYIAQSSGKDPDKE